MYIPKQQELDSRISLDKNVFVNDRPMPIDSLGHYCLLDSSSNALMTK